MNLAHTLSFEPQERAALRAGVNNLEILLEGATVGLYPNGMDQEEVTELTAQLLGDSPVSPEVLRQSHFLMEALVLNLQRRVSEDLGWAKAYEVCRTAAILLTRSLMVVQTHTPPPTTFLFGPDHIKEGSHSKAIKDMEFSDVIESQLPFFNTLMMASKLVGVTVDRKRVRVLKSPANIKGTLPISEWARLEKEVQHA